MSIDSFIIAFDSKPGEVAQRIAISLVEDAFGRWIEGRETIGATQYWTVSYPVVPAMIEGVRVFSGTQLIFDDEADGHTSSIMCKGACGHPFFMRGCSS